MTVACALSYPIRRFITAFRRDELCSLSRASEMHSTPLNSTSSTSILILYSHLFLGLPSEFCFLFTLWSVSTHLSPCLLHVPPILLSFDLHISVCWRQSKEIFLRNFLNCFVTCCLLGKNFSSPSVCLSALGERSVSHSYTL